jgi:cytochrome c553
VIVRPRDLTSCAAAVLAVVALLAPPASAQQQNKKGTAARSDAPKKAGVNYAERFASVCAACHGANGRSDMPGTPVLAGQPSFYAATQLFMFREGRRNNEAMTAVAKTLTDADLRGFSDYIGTLPPVPAPAGAEPPDAARMGRGQTLAQQYKCVFCHGADLSGGQQVPRLAGQREDYLLMSLKGFKTGTRPGYSMAMSEALSPVPIEDLDTLAYYAARFPAAAAKPAGK